MEQRSLSEAVKWHITPMEEIIKRKRVDITSMEDIIKRKRMDITPTRNKHISEAFSKLSASV